jgi:hypothetical protein
MSRVKKILTKAKASPNNVDFEELCYLVVKYGYVLDRTVGSHKIYKHPKIQNRIGALVNIQEFENGKAKSYQVREVLRFIEEFGLEQEGD